MKRLAALSLCAALAALPAGAADLDERWVREGAESRFSLDSVKAMLGTRPFDRSIAVVIGVGDYTNGWTPLEAPAHDVRRVADFLKGQGAFDIVHTLTDGAATRERIRRLMVEELPREVGPNDRVLFYFSGHGTQRALYGDRVLGYLALADSAPEGYSSMIDMGALENWWYGIAHARQSLFILDACFSGLGLQSKGDGLRARTIEDLSKRGHHLVTAGTEDQQSYANLRKWGGSLFTTALIDGMRGRADSETVDAPKDGIVSLRELWDYTTKRIRAEVPSGDMTPQRAGFETTSEGEFFFVADPEAALSVSGDGGDGSAESKGGIGIPVDPEEYRLWNAVKDSGDAALLEGFLARYPSSIYAPLIDDRLAAATPGAPSETTPLAEERFARGNAARDAGRIPVAVQNYKVALTAQPGHAGAALALADLYANGRVTGEPEVDRALAVLEDCDSIACRERRHALTWNRPLEDPETLFILR